MPELTVKFLEHCEPGELIRVSFVPDSGSWGIVGYVQATGGPKKQKSGRHYLGREYTSARKRDRVCDQCTRSMLKLRKGLSSTAEI